MNQISYTFLMHVQRHVELWPGLQEKYAFILIKYGIKFDNTSNLNSKVVSVHMLS
jgi:hypothetical protein